jgi:hypothetical protein
MFRSLMHGAMGIIYWRSGLLICIGRQQRNIKAPFTRNHQIKSHRRGCGVVYEVALEASHLTCPSSACEVLSRHDYRIIVKSEGADGK